MSIIADPPHFTDAECVELLYGSYELTCSVKRLPSERDLNLLATADSGERYVLKIANAAEDRAFLDAQVGAMQRLSEKLDFCPRVVDTRAGETSVVVASKTGAEHVVRLVTYLAGRPMGDVRRHSSPLFDHLGECLGRLDAALADFDHPALHRRFDWDLARAPQVIARDADKVADGTLGNIIGQIVSAYAQHVAPLLCRLPKSAIHGDANDFNVIVGGGSDPFTKNQSVTGIVDFGDMIHSHTVNELAIAVAYAMLDKADPMDVACHLVQGYHRERRLSEDEIDAVFDLACMRLCLSACIAARQAALRPDDPYLVISQKPIRRTLPRLAAIPRGYAKAAFRHACGLPPVKRSKAIMTWLNDQVKKPVMGRDLSRASCAPIDLSVSSPLISGNLDDNSEPKLTLRLQEFMRHRGADVGIGLHGEARMFYQSQLFLSEFAGTREPRTIHMGMDLFAPAGSPVFSPLDGTLHAYGHNPQPLDYGHVIVLRHETSDGDVLFTLYGHLSQTSLNGLTQGQEIAAGTQIATLGEPAENGGWTPHLHFQIILDLIDLGLDFPGVCTAGQAPIWMALSPDPNAILGIPQDVLPRKKPSKRETQSARRRCFGPNLSLGYLSPVKIERGWMQYLYDETGRRYVDAYNNVPHVGHCHPRVVAAARRQMRVLNTNTRYLSDVPVAFAERLCATMPDPLQVCFFVNSASEGNELALRLARAATGCRDMIVLESAYHGHTTSLIDISPYKHAGPGGQGPPSWVHVAPIPDGYRGRYKTDDPDMARKYAAHVAEPAKKIERGSGLCGFIAETCPSVGGQIFFPEGYLARVYQCVRSAGGLCIADEVQTGYGRIGTHFYAFEAHDVVPDIVVLGKPIGNGHPLSAVVTTQDIASAFDNGMEFFSTFGGNTVSCAVGLEVLKVVEEEGLQEHAREVGSFLLKGLEALKDRFELIGHVRGSGLFLGVELVKQRETLDPATQEAAFATDRLRDLGVLIGTDGPFHNVLKIRPPMPFSMEDSRTLLNALETVLSEAF